MEMFQQKDEAHLEAMYKMQEMMNDREILNKWIEDRKKAKQVGTIKNGGLIQ